MTDKFLVSIALGLDRWRDVQPGGAHGQMHANTDWALLEPVDRHYQPVPPRQPSATTLLMHPGNRVQPLIRYDLGDQIALDNLPCARGSPLPVIHASGHNDAPLHLRGRTDGSRRDFASGQQRQGLPGRLKNDI